MKTKDKKKKRITKKKEVFYSITEIEIRFFPNIETIRKSKSKQNSKDENFLNKNLMSEILSGYI